MSISITNRSQSERHSRIQPRDYEWGIPCASEVAEYFSETRNLYERYSRGTGCMHVGLNNGSGQSRSEWLTRANDELVEGLFLAPGQIVLDAGCGMGGLACFLAEKFKVRVIGISNCSDHVEMAQARARNRNFEDSIRFINSDFMDLPFKDSTFDVVINQESMCHASDLHAYFKGMSRVMKSGAAWVAVDMIRPDDSDAVEFAVLETKIRSGWKITRIPLALQLRNALHESGLSEVSFRDLSEVAFPQARQWMLESVVRGVGDRLGLSSPARYDVSDRVYDEHFVACESFGRGLLAGNLSYQRITAQKGSASKA